MLLRFDDLFKLSSYYFYYFSVRGPSGQLDRELRDGLLTAYSVGDRVYKHLGMRKLIVSHHLNWRVMSINAISRKRGKFLLIPGLTDSKSSSNTLASVMSMPLFIASSIWLTSIILSFSAMSDCSLCPKGTIFGTSIDRSTPALGWESWPDSVLC